jgi:imidazolonepropionase-like amidohydrolase/ABC-type multidrug transport system permease subunit
MKAYLALTANELRLAFRDKQVLFFNYLFPLIFFFLFGTILHADRGGAVATMVVTNVLVVGVLGNGFFGAGIRAVQEREQNILRRFKVAPISPLPILAASLTTGLLLFIPSILMTFTLARSLYALTFPAHPVAVLIFLAVGSLAFRSIGLIIAAVSNSVAESNLLVQILYMPMMFLGGAMFPPSVMPRWAQTVSQFIPATYLVSGVQSIVTQQETLASNWKGLGSLVLTIVIGMFVAVRLFRWEKEEKLKSAAKLWVAGVLLPFAVLGLYQYRTSEQTVKSRQLWRQLQRDDAFLVRNARIFVGDGSVVESASVLVRKGKIERIFEPGADVSGVKADAIEANGKTLMPGLIDVHVHLGAPGGIYADFNDMQKEHSQERALVQYAYSGVTTVKSVGDLLDGSLELRRRTEVGDFLGAELRVSGPLFTAEGGHGTEYFTWLEGPQKAQALEQFVRIPKTTEEASRMVRDLKERGVDAIKAVLETGRTGRLYERMDLALFSAVAAETNRQHLPLAVHTGNARDVEDAVDAGAASIEHGSFADSIPDAVFAKLAAAHIAYDPTLTVLEAVRDFSVGRTDLLSRSLVQQTVSQKLLSGTAAQLKNVTPNPALESGINGAIKIAGDNLLRAWKAGVPLVTGTDAGNVLVLHGPTVHREMQLWVTAGIPPAVALQAATGNAAKLLQAGDRIGFVKPGYTANLLLVDGDPTKDISATERISLVVLKGERVRRADLFDLAKNPLE